MRHHLLFVATLVLSGCQRAPQRPVASDEVAAHTLQDTSIKRLCATAPETLSTGTTGCVLKDQAPPPVVVKKPPQ
jgi:hypothetical protein